METGLRERVTTLTRRYHLRPRRQMGQHFLVDEKVFATLLAAAAPTNQDTVLEIGAGFGLFTNALAEKARAVIACESDRRLAEAFRQEGIRKNVRLHAQDVFRLNLPSLGLQDRGYLLASCLPYNITGLVFRHFLSQLPRPQRIALVIQKEVADRLVAVPGKMRFLSVYAQMLASVRKIAEVPPAAFWPAPAVESAIVSLTTRVAPFTAEDRRFLALVKRGFSAPRKMLRNTLAAGLALSPKTVSDCLEQNGIGVAVRPQDLSLDVWKKLAKTIFDTCAKL